MSFLFAEFWLDPVKNNVIMNPLVSPKPSKKCVQKDYHVIIYVKAGTWLKLQESSILGNGKDYRTTYTLHSPLP